MGAHLVTIDGVVTFQSDKYPSCPPGKVPLSVNDKTAQDLLWEYAQRRRSVDAEFSEDLERVLLSAGFVPSAPVPCSLCNGTGIIVTGNNDIPCNCPAGDQALFNVTVSGEPSPKQMTGVEVREYDRTHRATKNAGDVWVDQGDVPGDRAGDYDDPPLRLSPEAHKRWLARLQEDPKRRDE